MKKFFLFAAFAVLFLAQAQAQRFGTRKATISFQSETPMEKIEATNHTVSAVIDSKTGKFQFAVLIKGFQFRKALMQEHFNENYMESSKYPKASFKGQIISDKEPDFFHSGTYDVQAKGQMTIHGVTKAITVPAQIKISKAGATISAQFDVAVADYGIKIPSLVKNKIAKVVTVNVSGTLPKL